MNVFIKNLITSVFLIGFICSCNTIKKKNIIKPDILGKIKLIVNEYEEFVKQEKEKFLDPKVYDVIFEKFGDSCFVTISTNYFYNSNLDGYFFIDDNLITLNNVKNQCNEDYIIINEPLDIDKLSEYIDESNVFDDYDPAYWSFKIEQGKLIPDKQGRFKIEFSQNKQ